ncbi:MAG: glycosyltransferase, partial [Henriciella sp.]|uniref:glycosyltransferase family 2 protein n=1 Tax=Henriciella sp. TaxID=1968823 RepID=UPI003C7356E4
MSADGGGVDMAGLIFVRAFDDQLFVRSASPGDSLGALSVMDEAGQEIPVVSVEATSREEHAIRLDVVPGSHRLTLLQDGVPACSEIELDTPAVSGRIDLVGAGRVMGSVRRENATQQIWLDMDGRPLIKVTPSGVSQPRGKQASRRKTFTFDLPLPAEAMDGEKHAFTLRSDNRVLSAAHVWRAAYEFNVDAFAPTVMEGWAFDPAAPHLPVKFLLKTEDDTFIPVLTSHREDVAVHKGAAQAGFRVEFKDPVERADFHLARSLPAMKNASFARFDDADFVESLRSMVRAYRTSSQTTLNRDVMKAMGRALSAIRDEVGRRGPSTVMDSFQTSSASAGEAAIVIPVYKGYKEVRACLESVERTVPDATQIVIINDKSPEPEIHDYLREFTLARRNTRLIENRDNLGFPRSVNRGLELVEGKDVVVLNADTRVPERWLERLTEKAHSLPNIASVTPLTNNGTIMSYPRLNYENYIDDAMIDELDTLFEKVATDDVLQVPTAVGFCMYMTAGAIADTGFLGEEWGKGYAEEVDWCLKARDLGYVHIAAPNVFVGHVGSVSFGAAVREDLSAKNNEKLSRKFPEFSRNVIDHLKNDPLRKVRVAADIARLKAMKQVLCFHVSNGLGGGTQHYVDQLSSQLQEAGVYNLMIEPHEVKNVYDPCDEAEVLLHSADGQFHSYMTGEELAALFKARKTPAKSKAAKASRDILHIHSTLGHHLDNAIAMTQAASKAGLQIAATIHDFSWICPRVQMLRWGTDYCNLPDLAGCDSCVSQRNFNFDIKPADIEDGIEGWLAKNLEILNAADVIISPSEFPKAAILERFPDLDVKFIPHFSDWIEAEVKPIAKLSEASRYRVGFVGAIGDNK